MSDNSSYEHIPITLRQTVVEIREGSDWVEVYIDKACIFAGHRLTTAALEEIVLQLDPLYDVQWSRLKSDLDED